VTGINAEGMLGYSSLCSDFPEKPLVLVMPKHQSTTLLRGLRHIIGTAQELTYAYLLTSLSNILEHELQQIVVAQILSWSPTLQPK